MPLAKRSHRREKYVIIQSKVCYVFVQKDETNVRKPKIRKLHFVIVLYVQHQSQM